MSEIPTNTVSLSGKIKAMMIEHINQCREDVIKQATKEFEIELRRKIALVTLNLANYYSIEYQGTVLHIKIDTKANT